MTTSDLLTDLGPASDLARLVERVTSDQLPWVVVSTTAVTAWTRRDSSARRDPDPRPPTAGDRSRPRADRGSVVLDEPRDPGRYERAQEPRRPQAVVGE